MELNSRTTRAVALILAFPALVALQLTLLALDAPHWIMSLIALVTWFIAPVLPVVGVVMLVSKMRWTFGPRTSIGKLSLWLAAGFAAFFLLFGASLAAHVGPDNPERFFDNLYLALTLLLAGACAVAAGLVGALAVFFRKDRSILVVGLVAFGAIVAIFTLAEIGGHEEPPSPRRTATPSTSPSPAAATPSPSTAPGTNSHSNVSFANVAPGQVRVSFDYAYNNDPPGGQITANTITPLASGGQPLPGAEPVVKPIARGSGHIDVTFTFTEGQIAALEGFSICFTGPGGAEFGCASTGYGPN